MAGLLLLLRSERKKQAKSQERQAKRRWVTGFMRDCVKISRRRKARASRSLAATCPRAHHAAQKVHKRKVIFL